MRSILIILSIVVLIGGCASPQGGDDLDTTTAPPDTAAVDGDTGETAPTADLGVDLSTLLEQAHTRSPDTQELTIIDRLNEPARVSIDTQQNRHYPDRTDTLRTLHYDRVDITVHEASGGKELMKNVTVTGSGLISSQGLEVGMTRSEVESTMGQSGDRQNGAYVYEQNGPMPTYLYVHFQNDEVSRLEWQFPID